jgi:hypothetical protein
MPFAWRREDSGYFAALVGAAAVVVYLVFGNFGLLPAPFAAPSDDSSITSVEPVVATPATVGVQPEPVAEPRRPVTPPRPDKPAASVDTTSPTISVSTEPGTVFGVTEPANVIGVVKDAGTGIEKVLVRFAPGTGSLQTVTAKMQCQDATRRDCGWSAAIPATVADYTVTAVAIDRAGNETSSKAIDVTVVNPAGPVEQVTDTVARVPSAVGKAVNGLLTGLLGARG